MGQTSLLPADSGDTCVKQYGYWLSSATNSGKVVPETMLSSLPYEKLKSYANWFTESFATNITFKNWDSGVRSCSSSKEHRVFGIPDDGSDHVPVNWFENCVFENVHDDAFAYLFDPPEAWAIVKDCGAFPCTGPHNAVLKFKTTSATGTNKPSSIPNIAAGTTFQIIPNNLGASQYISTCTLINKWNAYVCANERIAQLMFESLDSDKEDRTVSPIYLKSQTTTFKNTLNTFMDHCWDGHYTCQKRLSRFPGLLTTNEKYEIYYTGTQPRNTRYTIEGGETGVDWLHLIIDFSQSRLYKVYANDVLVNANAYNSTTNELVPISKTKCGENVYYKPSYKYEFYLTYGCTVRFEAQDFLEGMVRLQISYSDFFKNDGQATFLDKLTSALGITQDQIRIVNIASGSTIIDWYVSSPLSTSTQRQKQLQEYQDKLQSKKASGGLDLGFTILDFTTQVVTNTGSILTGSSANYSRKDVHIAVYIILAIAAIATLVGVIVGIVKGVKMAKAYREVANMDTIAYEKGINESEVADQADAKEKEEL